MDITRLHTGKRMSDIVIHGDTIYLAGQVGNPGEDITAQTKTVLAEIDKLLADAGSSKSKILSAQIWLSDIRYFAEMNAVWDAWVDSANAPTRATGQALLAGPEYLVEIIIVAAR